MPTGPAAGGGNRAVTFARQAADKIQQSTSETPGRTLGARVEQTAQAIGETAARVAVEQVAVRAANALPGGEIAARVALHTRPGQRLVGTVEKAAGETTKRAVRWGRWVTVAALILVFGPSALITLMLFGMFLGGGVSDSPPPMGELTFEQQNLYETVGVSPLVAYSSDYTTLLDTVTVAAVEGLLSDWTATLTGEHDTVTNVRVASRSAAGGTISFSDTGSGLITEAVTPDGRVTEGPWHYRTDRADCHPAVLAVKHVQHVTVTTPRDCWTLEPPTAGFQPPGTVVEWIRTVVDAQNRCVRAGLSGCGNAVGGAVNTVPAASSSQVLANDFYTLWLAWHNPQVHVPHHYPLDGDYKCAATFYEGRLFPTAPTMRGTAWMAHLRQMRTDGNPISITDIEAGCADNRLLLLIGVLSARWPMHMSTVRSYHGETISGSRVESSHHRGRAVDIWMVGEPDGTGGTSMNRIRYGTDVGKGLWDFIVYELFLQGRRLDVDQLGSPFPDIENIGGVFTDDDHRGHFHIAVCGVRYWNYYERTNLRDSCGF